MGEKPGKFPSDTQHSPAMSEGVGVGETEKQPILPQEAGTHPKKPPHPSEKVERNNRAEREAVVTKKFQQAHAEWKGLPEAVRGKFTASWLQKNGYTGLDHWMRNNGGAPYFAALAGSEIEADFAISRIEDRDTASVVDDLRALHGEWKVLLPDNKKIFNSQWIRGNDFALYMWVRRHGGLDHFISLAGGEVAQDFGKRVRVVGRTLDSAVRDIIAAHTKWKEQPENERGEFHRSWLDENGYRQLQAWIRKYSNIDFVVELAGEEVQKDFGGRGNVEKTYNRTTKSVAEELRAAHAIWKSLPEVGRDSFNISWLQKNGYAGLDGWMRSNGGVHYFITFAGGM